MASLTEKHWGGWSEGELQIHFIHTGAAESIFFIFPDGTTMLDDCGDYPAITRWQYAVPVVPGPHRLAGDWIARYVQRVLPENTPRREGRFIIDYMYISHYHCDHCGTPHWQCIKDDGHPLPGCNRSGFALAAEELSFDIAIDRDWPGGSGRVSHELEMYHSHVHSMYKALQKRDGLKNEAFRIGELNQIKMRRSPEEYPDFSILNILANGMVLCKDGTIKDIYAEELKRNKLVNENGMSTGFILKYGDFSFYTGGDFDSEPITGPDGNKLDIEDALAEELPKVNVAKINHHGFRNMTNKLVAALAARVWVVNVTNTREVSEDTLQRISDRGNYPDPRTIFPTVFADSRVAESQGKAYFQDIAPETFGKGCHVIISVTRGGKSYTVTCLDASNEEMNIKGQYHLST